MSLTDSHWESIDDFEASKGFEWNQMLAIVGFSGYTNTISLDKDNYDWFNLTEANNLMQSVKERGHFFGHNFGSDLDSVTASSNLLDQTRWAAMQNFYTSNCQKFVHTNTSYYIKNISTTSDYTIDTNCKHFPTFAEINVNRSGLFNISVPSAHSAWFEFCMEVGLFGIYSEGGVSQLKWGFQYANEDSGWKITRPGSSSNTTNGKRLASYKDAVYKAKPPNESMQYYSSALVEDIKKCLEFNIQVKYILDDFGRKNTTDDYIGVASSNPYTFDTWETSTNGHEGRRYVGDADSNIGQNSSSGSTGKTYPVWDLDFTSLTNSFNLAKNDSITNVQNTTTSGSKPSFIGNKIQTEFNMYMSFEKSNTGSTNIPSYMFIDVDAETYKIDPLSGGYIRFKSPTGATYNLTGKKLLSQVTKPLNTLTFNSMGMGFTEGLQDLSSSFSGASSAVGNVSFFYNFSQSIDWSYAPTLIASPVSSSLTVPNNSESDADTVTTAEEGIPTCRSAVEYAAQIGTIDINGTSRTQFSGGAKLTVTDSTFPTTGTPVFRTMSESISTFLNREVKGYITGALPEEGDAYYQTDYKLEVAYNTPWSDQVTNSHYYKGICEPSEE